MLPALIPLLDYWTKKIGPIFQFQIQTTKAKLLADKPCTLQLKSSFKARGNGAVWHSVCT